MKKKYVWEFDADKDWKPYDAACWFCCPLACLTKLGHKCNAKHVHDNTGIDLCPFNKMKEITNETKGI